MVDACVEPRHVEVLNEPRDALHGRNAKPNPARMIMPRSGPITLVSDLLTGRDSIHGVVEEFIRPTLATRKPYRSNRAIAKRLGE